MALQRLPCGEQPQPDSNAANEVMDTLKGAALIATFIGVLITFAMWVSLWENVWQASVEPTRGAIYDARLIALALRLASAHHGCGGGRRVVA